MTDTPKRLYRGQPGTGATDLYGPAVSGKTIILSIHLANTTNAPQTISISTGASGVDTAATRFFEQLTIPAYGADDWEGFQVLEVGDYIVGKQSSGTAITATISGVEIT